MKIQTTVVWNNGNKTSFNREVDNVMLVQVKILDEDGKLVAGTEWASEEGRKAYPRRLPDWEDIAPFVH